jgi:DNA modification methylase
MLPRVVPVPGHEIIIGDVLDCLKEIPDGTIQCCVTSPPYFGLRDYGTGRWEGGDPQCDHKSGRFERGGLSSKQASNSGSGGDEAVHECPKCGAIRIDQQIGLEQTTDEYISKMVAVFREVRRVLRGTGVCFINIADSYAGGGGYFPESPSNIDGSKQSTNRGSIAIDCKRELGLIKPKDMMLMPFRLAIALQEDGWWIRDIIVWHKPGPMPSSVRDRCTSSWEPIIMMAKSARYFADMESVKQYPANSTLSRLAQDVDSQDGSLRANAGGKTNGPMRAVGEIGGANLRNVWKFSTEGTSDAHFACYPTELPSRCIKIGTSERGQCPHCGSPWERIVETIRRPTRPGADTKVTGDSDTEGNRDPQRHVTESRTVGFYPTCDCDRLPKLPKLPKLPRVYKTEPIGIPGEGANRGYRRPEDNRVHRNPEGIVVDESQMESYECESIPIQEERLRLIKAAENVVTVPQIILDPFTGSGTTQKAARILGRHSIGCELNAKYVHEIAIAKIQDAFEEIRRPKAKKQEGQKSVFE